MMNNFSMISEALKYIDEHLSEQINVETISSKFFFSPFYFHRLFSAIVGKTLAAYIRERRILYACRLLSGSDKSILDIALDNGFHSAQGFSRTFTAIQGICPSEYRKQGHQPIIVTAKVLIEKFTNRLKGGIFLNPTIMKQKSLMIAGTCGDGNKTWDAWDAFERLNSAKPLSNALSMDGYEVRVQEGDTCTVYVGYSVSSKEVDSDYSLIELPASKYASFEIYVINGYESENSSMDEWLKTNKDSYSEKLMNGLHYCVEYYDQRFNGSENGSIVEIWIPIEKLKSEQFML